MGDTAHPVPAARSLADHLRAGGATDIRTSCDLAWVIARVPSGNLIQVLWWEAQAAYYVSREVAGGAAAAEPLGTFPDRDAAIACALHA